MAKKPAKQIKEVTERIERMGKEKRIENNSIAQAVAMIKRTGQLFLKSKTDAHVTAPIAMSWLTSAMCDCLGDLIAFSVKKGFVVDLQQLTISCATQIHNKAQALLEEPEDGEIIKP